MKKRIGLYLGADVSAGGVYQYNLSVLEAVHALPRDSFEKVVCTASAGWSPHLSACGIPMVLVRKGWLRRAFWKTWRTLRLPTAPARELGRIGDPLARIFLKQQCDLWLFPSLDRLAFEVPVRSLAAIHDLMHRYEKRFPEVSAGGTYRLREWCFGNICRWSAGVLVDSETGRKQVRESYGLPDDRIHVLPYVAPAYIADPSTSVDVIRKYSLPKKFLFYPANFWEHKNHRNLIEAILQLKEKLPDISLVLAGTPDNAYGAVMERIGQAGLRETVFVLGYVPNEDIAELYRRARALVMPTYFGPTNIPPLEAFAAGCPVAVSDIYGIPEQVGDAALLFDPASIQDIADCIRRLWTDDDLCATLAGRGRMRAAAWDQQQFNVRLHAIIERVI
ncbi:MAG: glycosyltransferase family 4 protein [Nitrospirota bacterium]